MVFKKQTHCKQGHEFTEENTLVYNDGQRRCKKCKIENGKKYHEKNKEKHNIQNKTWALEHPTRMRELGRRWDRKHQAQRTEYRREVWWNDYNRKLRRDVFTVYGNGKMACVCCGEETFEFLTIDHINGRTKDEKKNPRRRGWMGYQYLRANGFPPGHQTLCWNCNSGRQLNNGVCPHKSKGMMVQ